MTTAKRRTVAAVRVDSIMIIGSSQGELLRPVPVCVVKGEEERLGTSFPST